LTIVARLQPGAQPDAERLLANGPPFDPAELGLRRHADYQSPREVVFMFEGEAVDAAVREFVNDPARSTVLARWRALVEGPPRIAHERYFWQANRGRPVECSRVVDQALRKRVADELGPGR
jgi:hypothetical protein